MCILSTILVLAGLTYDKPKAGDLAMVVYTSGTKDNPKGVMLSHRNIVAAISGQIKVFPVTRRGVYMAYLPLTNIAEFCAELIIMCKGPSIGYSSAETMFDCSPNIKPGTSGDCAKIQPCMLIMDPAVLDHIFKNVIEAIKRMSPWRREIFQVCYERKRAGCERVWSSLIMNKLVSSFISSLIFLAWSLIAPERFCIAVLISLLCWTTCL